MKKILAGFMAVATMLTCTSLNLVSAETATIAEETTDIEIREKGTLYIRKGGYKVIPNSLDAFNIKSENEAVAAIENHPYICDMYQVRAVENGTTTVSFAPVGATSYIDVWNIVVDDYPETLQLSATEIEFATNDNRTLNIMDPYCDSYYSTLKGVSIYNDNATWSSDNENVVKVELGRLYPQSVGTATVTAELDGVVYECKVTVTPHIYPKGDISQNDEIDLWDAIMIAKYMIGAREFTEEEKTLADFDGNGEVNLYDAIGIAKELTLVS